MEIAGALMEKGVNAAKIIDDSFYRKTYAQNQILGKALLGSTRILDGRCIFSVVSQKEMEFTVSIRTIWMALSISSGLPKEWNVHFHL